MTPHHSSKESNASASGARMANSFTVRYSEAEGHHQTHEFVAIN